MIVNSATAKPNVLAEYIPVPAPAPVGNPTGLTPGNSHSGFNIYYDTGTRTLVAFPINNLSTKSEIFSLIFILICGIIALFCLLAIADVFIPHKVETDLE